ncbi:transposase [Methylotuvimicrobium sp. KM1]|uniref:transposase n=1 Tax=Methylotuvimicrobium sp. KM1 TaxID=3377707 RepID=UPI00384C408C
MQEFDEWFPNEVACIEYLWQLRWPEGFQCPNCGKNKACLSGCHTHLLDIVGRDSPA